MHTDRAGDALTAFDHGHAEFVAALEKVPSAGLRFRPPGEDYALGGLAVHVAQVLEKYARVLQAIQAADCRPTAEPPSPAAGDAETALVRDGFDHATLAGVLERLRLAHASVVAAVQAVPRDAFQRATPVTYAGAAEPFATSPADILGWVNDHYTEHVRQVTELGAAWHSSPGC